MSFFASLFSAFRKRARSRSATPRPRPTTLCILPLEDRITPSTAGGWGSSMYQYSYNDPVSSANPVPSVRVTFTEALGEAGPSVPADSIVIDPRAVDQPDNLAWALCMLA